MSEELEKYVPVFGFEKNYYISENGNIKNNKNYFLEKKHPKYISENLKIYYSTIRHIVRGDVWKNNFNKYVSKEVKA